MKCSCWPAWYKTFPAPIFASFCCWAPAPAAARFLSPLTGACCAGTLKLPPPSKPKPCWSRAVKTVAKALSKPCLKKCRLQNPARRYKPTRRVSIHWALMLASHALRPAPKCSLFPAAPTPKRKPNQPKTKCARSAGVAIIYAGWWLSLRWQPCRSASLPGCTPMFSRWTACNWRRTGPAASC